MPVPKSKYPCPNCGEYQLTYPNIKGEWGWKDTGKYFCHACQHEFSAQRVRVLDALSQGEGKPDELSGSRQ